MNRRTFYERAIFAFTSLIGALTALPALAYLLIPGRHGDHSAGWTEAGSVDDLPLDEPTELVFQRKRVDAWKTSVERATAWVVRREDGVTAFAPQCTHLGCGYRWVDDRDHFLCPCHDSVFGPAGEVLSGPAPRPLDRYEVRVEGGRLWIGQIVRNEEA